MTRFSRVFNDRYSSWAELEDAIDKLLTAQEKGEAFEEFVYLYLLINKDYYQIDKIFRNAQIPKDINEKLKLESSDYGVDGVFTLEDGLVAAYQAKFRTNRGSATVRELATFWAESGRADYKYVIANATSLPKQADKHGKSILADKFDSLDEDFFDNLYSICSGEKKRKVNIAVPEAYQERMISRTLNGFQKNDRGKLIAACGAGKTLVSLWIVEKMDAKTVLFLAPSLALISQTLSEWSKHKSRKFSYLCVCSDSTVIGDDIDYGDYDVSEVDFPVTTDFEKISEFLNSSNEYKYIFSTYNSAHAVAKALEDQPSLSFDITIFDEAHRTAGHRNSELFSIALDDKKIRSNKRLFMTATERLVRPWIIEKAAEYDRVVFSMDDKKIYGETFDRYSFGEAIKDKVISDYRIVLTSVPSEEVAGLIKANQLLIAHDDEGELSVTAENIFRQIVLYKAMDQFDLRKTISFHSSVARAKDFINGSSNESVNLGDLFSSLWQESNELDTYYGTVNGQMPAGDRKRELNSFKNSELGIISNAKCLTEGIDVPVIDSIYFVDPKTSLIDIVQACGRALRKSRSQDYEKGFAYFIVPIITSSEDKLSEIDEGKYEMLLKLVQALRDQDERLADWIEEINLRNGQGGELGPRDDDPILIDMPFNFDINKFTEQVKLKIITANSEPTIRIVNPEVSIRRSSFQKIIKPICDTTFETLFTNLVDPTIEKFGSVNSKLTKSEISLIHNGRVSHNNRSHSERVGVIVESDDKIELTELGKKYLLKEVDKKEIFKQAIIDYEVTSNKDSVFPYRAFISLLITFGSVNFIEFLYGIYTLEDSTSESLNRSQTIISEIKDKYPRINDLSSNNKEITAKYLNERYGYDFRPNELWGSTTTKNKFGYFKNHLSVFEGITSTSSQVIMVKESMQDFQDILDAADSGLLDKLENLND